MRDLGRWRHHDPRAGDLSAPAQVEVLAQHRDQRVEAAQRFEEVRAYEGHATGGHEDVALQVLLAVVDLARLDPLLDDAEAVRRLTDVQQDERVVVGHDLGRDDAGVGAKGRLHHLLDGVALEEHVVMTEEEESRPLGHQRGLVARRPEALVLLEGAHKRQRSDRSHALRDVLGLPVRHDEQA